jgi:IS1 family transposase
VWRFSGSVAKFDFWAKSKNLVSGIQGLTDSKTLEKATVRQNQHINLRTRIKRLVRRTICFSKTTTMHDLVIGLFINRYEFGVAI